jgi:NAD(P)-dependent dehydrogenase (short-subunit alcohol dehydrogenase family)
MTKEKELAVVVGAAGNMGTVICAALVKHGLRVIAIGRTDSALANLAAKVSNVTPCIADIANDDAIGAIQRAVDGPVRLALNCAGVPVAGGIIEAPTNALEAAFAIKITGTVRLVRGVEARLVRGARLIAMGGHYGFEPVAYHATAGLANAALPNLMRQFSLAYGERGITGHVIASGPADTDRLRKIATERAASRGVTVEAILDEMRAESALKTLTTPAQVAWAVTTLLAPEADALTGSTLMLDSGRRKGLP